MPDGPEQEAREVIGYPILEAACCEGGSCLLGGRFRLVTLVTLRLGLWIFSQGPQCPGSQLSMEKVIIQMTGWEG